MSELLRLALTLLATPPQRRSSTDTIVALAATAVVGLAVVAAVACAAAATWIGLHPLVGPIGAPLIVAGAFVVVALVGLTTARHALRPPSTSAAPPAAASNEALLVEASRLVAAHKAPVLLAAVLAGVVAGSREK